MEKAKIDRNKAALPLFNLVFQLLIPTYQKEILISLVVTPGFFAVSLHPFPGLFRLHFPVLFTSFLPGFLQLLFSFLFFFLQFLLPFFGRGSLRCFLVITGGDGTQQGGKKQKGCYLRTEIRDGNQFEEALRKFAPNPVNSEICNLKIYRDPCGRFSQKRCS